MKDWQHFWNTRPAEIAETEFLKQVGKTVGGTPISKERFEALVSGVIQRLCIQPQDKVLDLCCGNGLITARIASKCKRIIGVDYSEPLIQVARKHHQPENASYYCASVLELPNESLKAEQPFDKVYMYEALQHFKPGDLSTILKTVDALTTPAALVLLASVPDNAKLWNFYNTPERRADYYERKKNGTEAIGTWWEQDFVRSTCTEQGFHCEFLDQNPTLHTAHYRFDLLLTKNGGKERDVR